MAGALDLKTVKFQPGAYIIVTGAKAEKFYILLKGKAKVIREVNLDDSDLPSAINPGDFFGLSAAMANKPYEESIVAESKIDAIVINRNQFEPLISTNATVAKKMINKFSHTLRSLNKQIAVLAFNKKSDETPEQLFNAGEFYQKEKRNNQAYHAFKKYLECGSDKEKKEKAQEALGSLGSYIDNEEKEDIKPINNVKMIGKSRIVFCEGELGDELYVVQSGEVKITKIIDGKEVVLALLKSGDMFGEMALLENKPRTASAIVEKDASLLVISRKNYEVMITRKPDIILRLITILAERIWSMYKQMVCYSIPDPMGRIIYGINIELDKRGKESTVEGHIKLGLSPKDICNLVGITPNDGLPIINDLIQKRKLIALVDGKITIARVDEIVQMRDLHIRKFIT